MNWELYVKANICKTFNYVSTCVLFWKLYTCLTKKRNITRYYYIHIKKFFNNF